jgi:hypothetical protein
VNLTIDRQDELVNCLIDPYVVKNAGPWPKLKRVAITATVAVALTLDIHEGADFEYH